MSPTKVVYLTAGAGGMFCGSCMHDNALARGLIDLGLDVLLVPTYTPIRTDEDDVSVDQVFFGGINVFLQQKIPPLRWLPGFLDRFLDNPRLIRRVTSRSIDMAPSQLGQLAVSMLKGMHGNQRKEVKRLVKWLDREACPDVIVFTNVLIGGCIPEIKKLTGKPVLVTLQGDDVFLDSLPDPFRHRCLEAIRNIVPHVDGFITHSEFYRDYMSKYFGIPSDKMLLSKLGIDTNGFEGLNPGKRRGNQLGYLARLAPEKGLHHLVDAFIAIKQSKTAVDLELKVAGWLGKSNEAYANEQFDRLRTAGLESDFEYCGSLTRDEKLAFLESLDVFSVPTSYLEPKGLYVLEAMAAGLPVVQPDHGCFPEVISETGGGILYRAGDTDDLASQITSLLADAPLRSRLADSGRRSVLQNRNINSMANSTKALIEHAVEAELS